MQANHSKTLKIGFLSISALILFIAQFIPVQPTQAMETIKDRDYTLVSSRSSRGGEMVYVLDNRSGQVAIFTWNNNSRSFDLAGVTMLADGFAR